MKCFLILLAMVFSLNSMGQEIFKITKSRRSKNVLHFTANTRNCNFISPSVGNHWVMGEEDGHLEGLTNKEKPYFSPKISYTNNKETTFSLGALEKMSHKINVKDIDVRIINCRPKAFIEVAGREIHLQEIYVNVNIMMLPVTITIKGRYSDGSHASIKVE